MTLMPDLPAFLARPITPSTRAAVTRQLNRAAERRMPVSNPGKTRPWLPKTMSPEAWALLREQERAREAARAARIAALRARP